MILPVNPNLNVSSIEYKIKKMESTDTITFRGHPLISAFNKSTLMFTREEQITSNGDCIIGVKANKSCFELTNSVKQAIKINDSTIKIMISVGKYITEIVAKGNSKLSLDDQNEIVIRKSEYLSPRTLAICSNKAAIDIDREVIDLLKDPNTIGIVKIIVKEN